jgi:hypothetical protein
MISAEGVTSDMASIISISSKPRSPVVFFALGFGIS